MKPEPKDSKNSRTAKRASLEGVLKKNEKIKETVKGAADELTTVNEVLKKEKPPAKAVDIALDKNKVVEQKVTQAAEDLKSVNLKLTKEIAGRIVIESELANTKTDLEVVRKDLSKAQVVAEEAQQIALKDPLTGLPNRVAFEQAISQGLVQAKRHEWGLAVLFIDLDKFKNINDTYGHDLGDQVLLMVADRLKAFVRDEDMVSRWGGDEFVCLLPGVKQEADVTLIAEKMVDRIAETYEFDGHELSIMASIGIAIYPHAGDTPDILFKNADKTMYKAKGTKKRVVLFKESGRKSHA